MSQTHPTARRESFRDVAGETMAALGHRFRFFCGSYGWSAQCKRCGEHAIAPGSFRWAEAHDCGK